MASENETIADIVKRVRRDCNSYPLPTAAAEMLKLVREVEAAHRREVAELKSKMNDVVCENEALREACGTCCAKREVAELRKGISELLDGLQAIYVEECTSYGTGEVYDKWRKALKGAIND